MTYKIMLMHACMNVLLTFHKLTTHTYKTVSVSLKKVKLKLIVGEKVSSSDLEVTFDRRASLSVSPNGNMTSIE